MFYHFTVHNDSDGLWAECIELEGCITQAENIEELKKNMKEALDLYLDEPADSKIIFSLPNKAIKETNVVIQVKVEPQIAFSFYLRLLRLQHHLTQKQVSDMLEFKNIYSYQRLESSKKANPELKTLVRIKEIFPEFDLNFVV